MKFNRLTIHNITSIVDAVIEFDQPPLADEPLFLISGGTGAGKTTILNAICLALFNQTPFYKSKSSDKRTGELPPNDSRHMMRKGTRQASVELVFTADDDRVYTARWSVATAPRSGKLQDVSRELVISDGEDTVTLTRVGDIKDAIHAAMGLTYEQFSRTVMLAQGQFTAFLKAEDKEKSDILEKLTGTGIYTVIGQKIADRRKEAERDYDLADATVKGAKLMDEEEKGHLRADSAALAATIDRLAAEIAVLETRLNWLRRRDELIAERAAKVDALSKAEAEAHSPENQARIRTVADWEATAEVRALIATGRGARLSIDRYTKRRNELSVTEWPQILGGVEWLAKAHADAVEGGTALDAALAKAKESSAAAEARVKQTEEQLAACDIRRIEAEREQLQREVDAVNADIAAVTEYRRCREAFAEKDKVFQDNKAEHEALTRQIAEIESRLPDLREAYTVAKARLDGQMELRDHIASLRRSFADTGECPLCGTPGVHLHTDEAIDAKVAEARAAADSAHTALHAAESQLGAARATFAKVATALPISERNRAKALQLLNEAADKVGRLPACDNDDCLDILRAKLDTLRAKQADVAARIQEAYRLRDNCDTARKNFQKAVETVHRAEQDISRHRQSVAEVEHRLHDCRAAIEALTTRISYLAPRTFPTECRDIEARIRFFSAEINSLDGAISSESTKLQEAETAIDSWIATSAYTRDDIDRMAPLTDASVAEIRRHIEKISENLRRATDELGVIDRQLDRHLKEGRLLACDNENTAGEAPAMEGPVGLRPADDTADVRPEGQCGSRVECSVVLQPSESSAGWKPALLDAEAVAEARQAKMAERDAATRQRAACDALLAADDRKAAELADTRARLAELSEVKERWDALYDVFGRADSFKRIAQSYVLRALLVKANYYLDMLTRRYRLDCNDGSLQINVTDAHCDNAVRGINSLSGGESFIVSLALALGLSAISRNRINVGTLFIDEGFDALDETTLDTVITVLDRLHSEGGRQIGIISHEPELMDRISAQIHLLPSGPGTSTIEVTAT